MPLSCTHHCQCGSLIIAVNSLAACSPSRKVLAINSRELWTADSEITRSCASIAASPKPLAHF